MAAFCGCILQLPGQYKKIEQPRRRYPTAITLYFNGEGSKRTSLTGSSVGLLDKLTPAAVAAEMIAALAVFWDQANRKKKQRGLSIT